MPLSPPRSHLIVGGVNEIDVMKRNFQVLRVKYEKSEEKVSEFREKLKETRLELSSRDRQLEVAKRMIQRINVEKGDIEIASEQGKREVRKLEAKLHQASDATDLQSKYARLKSKFDLQKEQLLDMESRMMLAEETNINLSQEIHVLKGALGMKEGLSDGALGSQARLLHQLSKSQEDCTSLAVQLAEGQRLEGELKDNLERAHTEISRLHKSRTNLDEQLDEARQQVKESVETATLFRREAEQRRAELSDLQGAMEEAISSKLRTEQQLRTAEQHASMHQDKAKQLAERLLNVERSSRLSIEALRTEVTIAVERAESRASDQRANWAVKEANLTEQCLSLKRELEALQRHMQETQEEHLTVVGKLKEQIGELEEEVNHARRAERDRVMEIGRLHGQIDTLSELNHAIKANLDSAEDKAAESADHVGNIRASLDEERDMTKQLRAQVELLESQQRKLESEHGEKEAHLQDQVKALRAQLALTSMEGDQVKAEVQAVRKQAVESANRSGNMDAYAQELLATIVSLTESKKTLQTYMLEQVAVFKAKLQRAEEENKLLRATQAASKPHLAVSSPAKTDFRDASLLARVTASAGNRESGESERLTSYSARPSSVPTRRSTPTAALYERAREATRMEDSDDEASAAPAPPSSYGSRSSRLM